MRLYMEAILEYVPRRHAYAPSRLDYMGRRAAYYPRQLVYAADAHYIKAALIYLLVVTGATSGVVQLGQILLTRDRAVRETYSVQAVQTYPRSTKKPLAKSSAIISSNLLPASSSSSSIVTSNLIPTNTNTVSNNLLPVNVSADGVVWPIQGKVTTQFGEPHLPYQATHTGIDISSARPIGVTPITVFKAGTVVAVNRSGGFGNHVIVDHGGGITSLYGHMADIQVLVGQQVKPGDVLGHEGSSGVSTGTHLHFEIRQNGTPVNPHAFVPGSP